MRYILLLLAMTTTASAQYWPPGGPRPDPREWGPDEGAREMPPWPRRPEPMPPRVQRCIYYGDCAPPRMPPFRYPPRYYY